MGSIKIKHNIDKDVVTKEIGQFLPIISKESRHENLRQFFVTEK
jgi:hypothetical protein